MCCSNSNRVASPAPIALASHTHLQSPGRSNTNRKLSADHKHSSLNHVLVESQPCKASGWNRWMTKSPLVEFCPDGIVDLRSITKHRAEILLTFPRGLALDRAPKTSGFLSFPILPPSPQSTSLQPPPFEYPTPTTAQFSRPRSGHATTLLRKAVLWKI